MVTSFYECGRSQKECLALNKDSVNWKNFYGLKIEHLFLSFDSYKKYIYKGLLCTTRHYSSMDKNQIINLKERVDLPVRSAPVSWATVGRTDTGTTIKTLNYLKRGKRSRRTTSRWGQVNLELDHTENFLPNEFNDTVFCFVFPLWQRSYLEEVSIKTRHKQVSEFLY